MNHRHKDRGGVCWFIGIVCIGVALLGFQFLPVGAAAGITRYDIGLGKNGISGVTAAPNGAIWFYEGYQNQVGRVALDGTIMRLKAPTDRTQGLGNHLAAAPDGGIWFTERGQLGHVAMDGAIAEYPYDAIGDVSETFTPAVGLDGSVWFSAIGPTPRIGQIATDGTTRYFPARVAPYILTAGPDGNMWFTINKPFDVPQPYLGVVTPMGAVSYVQLNLAVTGPLVYGPGGKFWSFAPMGNCGNGPCYVLVQITPGGGVTMVGNAYTSYLTNNLVVGADGNLWLSNLSGNVARITPTGQITEFSLREPDIQFGGIAANPDGDIVFFERHLSEEWGRVGRLDPTKATPLPDTPDFKRS